MEEKTEFVSLKNTIEKALFRPDNEVKSVMKMEVTKPMSPKFKLTERKKQVAEVEVNSDDSEVDIKQFKATPVNKKILYSKSPLGIPDGHKRP